MGRIAGRFAGIGEADAETTRGGEAAAAALATVFGTGIWSGYRSAGWKGAGVGAVVSFGTAFAALALAGAVTFPVVLAVGVASFFSGRWASDAIFRQSRISNYRRKLIDTAVLRLEQEMPEAAAREHFQAKAAQAVDALRSRVEQETEAVLQDANGTLLKVREEYAQRRTRTDAEVQAADQVRKDVTQIAERAAGVSHRLARVSEEATP
jgi:hypothetical protein